MTTKTGPKIPLVDLKAQFMTIRDEIDAAIGNVIANTAFVGGPEVAAFEKEFASYCETGYGVGASSGTTALHLALIGAGVGHGDEVVTVAHTFIATSEMIVLCGARVLFCDIDPATGNMDPVDLKRKITSKTKAIVPVDLYGCPVEIDAIQEIASQHGIAVIEDAAQAHGARYKGRRAGGLCELGTFSFYPGKNLGAYGDGGFVTCRSQEIHDRLQSLANHGRETKYTHDREGYNYRLDAVQAAILRVKLRHLDDWNRARRRVAGWYDERLAGLPGVEPYRYPDHLEPVYHLYVIRVHGDRDAILHRLHERGIGAGVHYPVPLHLQPAYRHLEIPRGALPHTEDSAARCLSLPIYAELSVDQVDRVVDALRDAMNS